MKSLAPCHQSRHHSRGITLIECLVYISAMAVVLGMGMAAYRRSIDHTLAVRRNTDDITQALAAGETWRADIRAATQTPRFDAAEQILHIPQAKGEVAYSFSEQQISRRGSAAAPWTVILPHVQQSEMLPEDHTNVTAWRWELELKTHGSEATVRPLFTFIAANR